jgi:3-deoxy-7-phosphoheptulonate synthase
MIVVLRKDITAAEKSEVRSFLEEAGFRVREIAGDEDVILGAVGRVSIDRRRVELLPGVDRVIPITKPYKLASRELQSEDTVVRIGPVRIGGGRVAVIAGPCAVESREQIMRAAEEVRDAGAVMLRGGAFKPRTSPYAFQGMGEEGLRLLHEAGARFGLPVVTEALATEHLPVLARYADVLQVGARNMQNFELLKKIGELGKPVLLKRGPAATIEEWLMAAEYLLAHGSEDVILCERGIRTFETMTRNTLDLSAIPVVKKLSHLPVLVDPSHGTGLREKVAPMALAAVAAGADGLLVEVHPDPQTALSDGPQSLYPEQFEKLMRDLEAISPVIDKEIERLPYAALSPAPEGVVAGTESAPGGPEARSSAAEAARVEKGRSPGKGGREEQLTVAFQGVKGAYSETAVSRFFDRTTGVLPCESFAAVFERVLKGEADFGLVPIENSLAGTVHEVLDLLLQYADIRVAGEQKIRIVHNLLGLPGGSIDELRRVYSHPQGLAQCAGFFSRNPQLEQVPFFDTAGAAAYVARTGDPSLGAIAGREAAEEYGLELLKEGIETNPHNYTRFFVIARSEQGAVREPNRAALVFSTGDTPGALYRVLKILADRGLNMKKLESRPIQGKPWQYMFFVTVDLPAEARVLEEALADMRQQAGSVRLLGRYHSTDARGYDPGGRE